jgi:hypothetical protein
MIAQKHRPANRKAGLLFLSWLSGRLLTGIELGKLAILRPRPMVRILRIVHREQTLPPACWTVDPPYVVCVAVDLQRHSLRVHKIPSLHTD